MRSNQPRRLTLVVTINDQEKAKWIWEAHTNPQGAHGVSVGIIAEGDQVTKTGEIVEQS